MSMEHSVEWLARETEALRENVPQCHFVHFWTILNIWFLESGACVHDLKGAVSRGPAG
jgi:hypothetical protein